MNVLFTTSTKVPTSLLMTATKNAKKKKDKHFCSHIWERPRLNIYKIRRESQDFCSWQQPKKRKKRKSQHFCSWGQKKKKRESPNIFGCGNNKYENLLMKFLAQCNEYEKRNYKHYFLLKTTYTQEEERKSLKSWSPSPLEWSSFCPHLPSIWLPSSSNNAKTFVYGLPHNDIVIFRVYPDPPLHLVIM